MRRLDIFRNDMGTISVALQHTYETSYGQDWVTEKGLLLPLWPRVMYTMSDDPWSVAERFQALQPSLNKSSDTTPTPNQSNTPN